MKWFILAFKKYAQFSGRSHRQEYWMFMLLNIIFVIVVRILDDVLGTNYNDSQAMNGGYISTLYSLVLFLPGLSITVRRLHDIGKSGWLYFWFSFAVIVASIVFVVYILATLMSSGAGDLDSLRSGDFDTSSLLAGNFILYTMLYVIFMMAISVWFIVLLAKLGNPGDNKYGPDPLATPTEEA